MFSVFRIILLSLLLPFNSYAGTLLTIVFNDGKEYSFQFEDMEEAAEFVNIRYEEKGCHKNVVKLVMESKYIEGIDDPEDRDTYYHRINKDK